MKTNFKILTVLLCIATFSPSSLSGRGAKRIRKSLRSNVEPVKDPQAQIPAQPAKPPKARRGTTVPPSQQPGPCPQPQEHGVWVNQRIHPSLRGGQPFSRVGQHATRT